MLTNNEVAINFNVHFTFPVRKEEKTQEKSKNRKNKKREEKRR